MADWMRHPIPRPLSENTSSRRTTGARRPRESSNGTLAGSRDRKSRTREMPAYRVPQMQVFVLPLFNRKKRLAFLLCIIERVNVYPSFYSTTFVFCVYTKGCEGNVFRMIQGFEPSLIYHFCRRHCMYFAQKLESNANM
jgi:hypothetical protein